MKARYILLVAAGMHLPTFAMAQVSAETLRACLDIEDQTKERLDCYDDKIKPAPKQVSASAKTVQDCRFVKFGAWPQYRQDTVSDDGRLRGSTHQTTVAGYTRDH